MGDARSKDFLGHPRGLFILAFTESWEMFSYYGMRTLLIYYMTQEMAFDTAKASWIYGAYNSFAYLTPILGGIIADKWLGARRSVLLGGIVMAIGHIIISFDGFFYAGLIAVGLGNGFFMTTLPAQVGALYRPDDQRRDRAFSVYYFALNLGAFVAPLICGSLGEKLGWHFGFGAAGAGMMLGLIGYWLGGKSLPDLTRPSGAAARSQPHGYKMSPRVRALLLTWIVLSVILLRGAYEQLGNAVALWTETNVDRSFGGWSIPSTWFQSVNPLGVLLFTPVLLLAWTRLGRRGRDPSEATKMAIGAALMAVSYVVLALIAGSSSDGIVGWPVLVFFLMLITVAELFVLPIGLSLFARLAPPSFVASIIAFWFAARAFGNLLSGWVGTWYATLPPAQFFLACAGFAFVAAGLLACIIPVLRRATSSVEADASGLQAEGAR